MLVNGLTLSEPRVFLSESEEGKNKGNGYRYASRSAIGSKLQLKIPRDRLGVFQPVILRLLVEQEEQVKNLCWWDNFLSSSLTKRPAMVLSIRFLSSLWMSA